MKKMWLITNATVLLSLLQIIVKIFVWLLSQTNRLSDVKAPVMYIYLGLVSSFVIM